jgi:hypothetical protein
MNIHTDSSRNIAAAPGPLAQPPSRSPSPKRDRAPAQWRPDEPRMTREEFRQIVMEMIG